MFKSLYIKTLKNGCKIIREAGSWFRLIDSDSCDSNVIAPNFEVSRAAKSSDRHNGL